MLSLYGVDEGRRLDLVGGGLLRSVGGWRGLKELRDGGEKVRADERILGGSEFVERVLRESEEEWERRSLLRQKGISLKHLLEKVSGHFGVDSEDLKSGSKARNVAKARAVLCYVGMGKVGLTSASVAKELGMSPSAASTLIVRAKQVSGHEDIEGTLL
jgi:putative transposase